MAIIEKKFQLGLLGRKLTHSFSQSYFTEKFEKENRLNFSYQNFEIANISDFPALWVRNPNLIGMNVTIPYKEEVLSYLDEIDEEAERIGAVNTIVRHDDRLIGFNTDVRGFENSLVDFVKDAPIEQALVLGTGGAAKAVSFVLAKLNIDHKFVSRSPELGQLYYTDLTNQTIRNFLLIINTTPLGMIPKLDEKPDLPYVALGTKHYLYDLIYNPEKSLFLRSGAKEGAQIKNGLQMLVIQAEKSWEIWNSYLI